MCSGCLVKGCWYLAGISNWDWGLSFFFFKCYIQSGVNKSRQLFLRKILFFQFFRGWWKVGFMAVHLSTLKQKIMFFFKLACCKEYLLIYSFVRRVISSTAITNVFLDNKQERDHLCAFDLGANYRKFHTLEKGYGDPFLHIFCQSLSV